MRVIHLIDSGGYYGAERVVLELITAQRTAGLDAELAAGERAIGSDAFDEKMLLKH